MFFVKHFILWTAFTFLLITALLSLELIEGYKISTTEYYGLQNLGLTFIVIVFLLSVFIYPVIVAPLSFVIRKALKPFIARLTLYVILSGASGVAAYHLMYDEYFVASYGLNRGTSVIIFALLGFAYAAIEHLLLLRIARLPDPEQPPVIILNEKK